MTKYKKLFIPIFNLTLLAHSSVVFAQESRQPPPTLENEAQPSGSSLFHHPRTLHEMPKLNSGEILTLKIKASLSCRPGARIATGFVSILSPQNDIIRKVRFSLFPFHDQQEIHLGSADTARTSKFEIQFDNPADDASLCAVLSRTIETAVIEPVAFGPDLIAAAEKGSRASPEQKDLLRRFALQHTPFIGTRYDRIGKIANDDIPLALGYTIFNKGREVPVSIKYSVVFSDQDAGKTNLESLDQQLAVWHRLTDIEWVYEVDFDSEGIATARNILWHVAFNYAQAAVFKGEFVAGGTVSDEINQKNGQPIVYVNSLHNSFSDSPSGAQVTSSSHALEGYHLVPEAINFPQPREELMFTNPWIFMVNDQELAQRESKHANSNDFIFVKIKGYNFGKGSWTPYIELNDSRGNSDKIWLGLDGTKSKMVDKLGTHLWDRSSYLVFNIGKDRIENSLKGEIEMKIFINDIKTTMQNKGYSGGLVLDESDGLRVFRLVPNMGSYQVEELTNRFEIKIKNNPQWSEATLKN